MEKALLDFKELQIKIYDSENSSSESYIFLGSIDDAVKYKISESLSALIKGNYSSSTYTETFENIIYVSHVFKSKTKRSVYQKMAFSNAKSSQIYNLPEEFREKNFRAILATKKGPFNKRKLNGALVDCKPFTFFETFFVGTTYDCIEEFAIRITSILFTDLDFTVHPSTLEEKEEWELAIEKVGQAIETNRLKEQIKIFYEQNHEEIIYECIYPDSDEEDYSWVDLGEEELENLDRETDNEWRLNID
jgi:hypothetical protein